MVTTDGFPSGSPRLPEALTAALADRYRIERELGQGGMATVYLAYDVKHDRKVALKVLKPELAAILGAERFLAEIKTTANLQHPHILSLFDSGEAGGQVYYVMPYVEGESLRDRLTREHQLPVDEAVRIAREIADALHYAHGHGVIHRDIKPENILLHGGHAQVADFGIALAVSRSDGGTRMTETGMSLGTPSYMSPEQAMGEREITPKSDIYALGCVTYEMLAGEPPFMGPTAQAIVARVMTEAPRSLQLQRRTIPTHVEAAVQRALEKLPADRFQSAAEFGTALGDAGYASRITVTRAAVGAPNPRGGRPWAAPAGLGAIAILTALAAWGWLRPQPDAPKPVLRYELGLGAAERFVPGGDIVRIAVSPDGSRLVYVGPAQGGTQLWLRERNQLHAAPIPNTLNTRNPVFAPDGRQLAFLEGARVRVISLDGGPAVTVADSGVLAGGVAWGDDGFIYYDAEPGLSRVPVAGGRPEVVFPIDSAGGEAGQAWSSALPGGKGVLFRSRQAGGGPDSYDIVAGNPKTGKRQVLLRGVFARFANSGHLLVVTADGNLLAAPFDPVALKLTGPAVPLLEGIAVKAFGAADLAVSGSGTLIYGGGSAGVEFGSWSPVWVERGGKETAVEPGWTVELVPGRGFALSPDGSRLALPIHNPSLRTTGGAGTDIWIKSLPGGPFTRLTFGDTPGWRPFWFPGGERVGFLRGRAGISSGVWAQRADGTGNPDSLQTGLGMEDASVSADGRWLVWARQDVQSGGTPWDIYGLKLGVDSGPRLLVASPKVDRSPRLSPDGRWLAYMSEESGRGEVYVRPFPVVDGGRWQVSLGGGFLPRWSPSGHELYFVTPDRAIMAARLVTMPAFNVVDRSTFKPAPSDLDSYYADYEVHPDGRRLLTARRLTAPGEDQSGLIVVENFTEELKSRVPQ